MYTEKYAFHNNLLLENFSISQNVIFSMFPKIERILAQGLPISTKMFQ